MMDKEKQFAVRFNFQKLLGMNVAENDFVRIAKILNVEEDELIQFNNKIKKYNQKLQSDFDGTHINELGQEIIAIGLLPLIIKMLISIYRKWQ